MPPIQPINVATKSIHRRAHEAWVQYFNGHRLFCTLGNNAVDYQRPYRPPISWCSGASSNIQKATDEEIKRELLPVCKMFLNGSFENCKKRLHLLGKLEPDIDILGSFANILREITGSKKSMMQEIVQRLHTK